MAREGHRRAFRSATATRDPFDDTLDKVKQFGKKALFIVLIVASVVLTIVLWPYLHVGIAVVALGFGAALWLLWNHPRWLFRHSRLLLGYGVLALVATAGLSVYRLGWGGSFGDAIAAQHIVLA